jgi:hypothetical protein
MGSLAPPPPTPAAVLLAKLRLWADIRFVGTACANDGVGNFRLKTRFLVIVLRKLVHPTINSVTPVFLIVGKCDLYQSYRAGTELYPLHV